MISGKKRRLQRIFRRDKRSVIIPMDHGVTAGPIQGLQNMQIIIEKLNRGGADAILLHKGIVKTTDTGRTGLIIHLSASTTLGPDPLWKRQVCSVNEALKLGADAVSVHINVGSPREHLMLSELGKVAQRCDDTGIPLLAMMYPRGPTIKNEHDPKGVAHAARLGAELGADIIKTNYTGDPETFEEVVSGCPVPIIIAGGPKTESLKDFFQMIHDSVKVGGAGVSIGRNVFQHEKPELMTKALVSIVHGRADAEKALQILSEKD
ncbi:MAG: 2-amino-3,7-dideoxy-D-threo-hept-6-ulosonate synthase [Candidatus Bathyarchaeia archaeon]